MHLGFEKGCKSLRHYFGSERCSKTKQHLWIPETILGLKADPKASFTSALLSYWCNFPVFLLFSFSSSRLWSKGRFSGNTSTLFPRHIHCGLVLSGFSTLAVFYVVGWWLRSRQLMKYMGIPCLKDNTENPASSLLLVRLSAWSAEETQLSHSAENACIHVCQKHFKSEVICVSVNYKS